MSDKKNIDRLFQEKFKDFEVTPNASVWGNITEQLSTASKQKKVAPLWWKIAGVAAGLLLLFSIGNLILNTNNDTPEEIIVNTDSETPIKDNSSQKIPTILDSLNSQEVVNENSTKEQSTHANKILNNNSKETDPNLSIQKSKRTTLASTNEDNTQKNDVKTSLEKVLTNKENKSDALAVVRDKAEDKISDEDKINEEKLDISTVEVANVTEKDEKSQEDQMSIPEVIAENNESDTNEIEETKTNKWSLTPTIAPVYFNSLGSGSSLHEQFNNNAKTGAVNMSYGISASYAINDKLSVRTGIHNVNLGYSTNDIVVYNNLQTASNNNLLRNVKLNKEGQLLTFISADDFQYAQVPGVLSNQINATIDQDLRFLEIPVELQYSLINAKLGVSIVGGFSALFLNNNDIYSVQNGKSILLGKATNINNMSYSANFGFGLDYKISKKINLNFEPIFKYQLNTFNNTSGNFKPYFFGVYTGFSFKF